MKRMLSLLLTAVLLLGVYVPAISAGESYVNVSAVFPPDTGADAADAVQRLIDENPNCTLFFADGEYLFSHPVYTPADPAKSVSMKLSDFAVIKAIPEDWEAGQAIVQLGGKEPYNTVTRIGSNYSFRGGYVDGSGVADGISINSGRETAVSEVNIKNTVCGLRIFFGANGGSSDADIRNVNIIGNDSPESTGILLEGHDNTVSNCRIGHCRVGVWLKSAGNKLNDIHPLFNMGGEVPYTDGIGFYDQTDFNIYEFCYADQYSRGFCFSENSKAVMTDCFCFWYTKDGIYHTAVEVQKKFDLRITSFTVTFQNSDENTFLSVGEAGGKGIIRGANISGKHKDKVYRAYDEDLSPIVRLFYRIILKLLLIK